METGDPNYWIRQEVRGPNLEIWKGARVGRWGLLGTDEQGQTQGWRACTLR